MNHTEWAEIETSLDRGWTVAPPDRDVWRDMFQKYRYDWMKRAVEELGKTHAFNIVRPAHLWKAWNTIKTSESFRPPPASVDRRADDERERALCAMEVDQARVWAAGLDPEEKKTLWEQFKDHPFFSVFSDGTDTQLMAFEAFACKQQEQSQ